MDFNLTVYFVRNPNSGEVKIGKTNNFESRYRSLCADAKCELEILLLVEGDDTERMLHRYFEEEHTKGEWFYFSDRLKAMIEASKKKGRLVYPEGEPQKRFSLLVDYRVEAKKAKYLEQKVSSLERQTQQAKQKRDEYKTLARKTLYYKDVVDNDRRKDRKQRETRIFIVFGYYVLALLLYVVFPLLLPESFRGSFVGVRLLMLLAAFGSTFSLPLFKHIAKDLSTKSRKLERRIPSWIGKGLFYSMLCCVILIWIGVLVSYFGGYNE